MTSNSGSIRFRIPLYYHNFLVLHSSGTGFCFCHNSILLYFYQENTQVSYASPQLTYLRICTLDLKRLRTRTNPNRESTFPIVACIYHSAIFCLFRRSEYIHHFHLLVNFHLPRGLRHAIILLLGKITTDRIVETLSVSAKRLVRLVFYVISF